METEKKPIYKRWWAWLAAIVVLGLIINLANGGKGSSSSSIAFGESTAEKVKDAAPYGCPVFYDSAKHHASMTYTETDMWNGYSLLRHHFEKGIDFARKAFAADSNLATVSIITKTELLDGNGNKDTSMVLAHTFTREPFMQIKWDNLRNTPILDQINRTIVDSESFMHPAIRKTIDADELPKELYLE